MRIRMVVQRGIQQNPFVLSLADGLVKRGHEVVCSLEEFWDSFYKYDLLFFQWPEAIFDWKRDKIEIERLSGHFHRIKEFGVRTVITCHNLHPHNNDPLTIALYDFVYSKVDAIHHLGRYSYGLFKEKYPHQYHFIVPHHIADSLWEKSINSSLAKEKLGIPIRDIVVSSFGVFRDSGEIWMFLKMAYSIVHRGISFLAPRIPSVSFQQGSHFKATIKYIIKRFVFKRTKVKHSGFLSEDELGVWLSASDIVFIQRKEILNSGNLPLAFSAGKVVVGPDLGNVGEILKETGNYVFDSNDSVSVKKAVLSAIDEIKKGNLLGTKNYQYARDNWTVSRVCAQIDKEFSMICNREILM